MRLGIADHLGWAVAVTADHGGDVVDRRRIELVEPGVATMPIHHDSKSLGVDETAALVATVRVSIARAATAAFDALETDLDEPIDSIFLRRIPADFPADIETQVQVPWEARADAVMYREVVAEVAAERAWDVRYYDAKSVLAEAADELGERADEVLQGPRARLGAPWAKDHRVALAATIVA